MDHKVGVLSILASLILLSYGEVIKNETICHPVKYINPNVTDKPDIFIAQGFRRPHIRSSKKFAICQMGRDDIQGKLVIDTDSPSSSKIDYDSQTGVLYNSEPKMVWDISLVDNVKSEIYSLQKTSMAWIDSLALDWVTKNIFLIKSGDISVLNAMDKTKASKTLVKGVGVNHVSIHVLPNDGYLIVKKPHSILRYNMDGSNETTLYKTENEIQNLAVDYYEGKIYWSERKIRTAEYEILYTNLAGAEPKTFKIMNPDKTVMKRYTSLQVDDKYVYYQKGSTPHSHIFRAHKANSTFDKDFDIYENGEPHLWEGSFGSFLINSAKPPKIAENHPCQVNNGGCAGYCVVVPGGSRYKKLIKKCIDYTRVNAV